jgi:hypothetical protein
MWRHLEKELQEVGEGKKKGKRPLILRKIGKAENPLDFCLTIDITSVRT